MNNNVDTKIRDGARTFFHSILLSLCSVVGSSNSTDLQFDWSFLVVFIIAAGILIFFLLRKYRGALDENISDVVGESEW